MTVENTLLDFHQRGMHLRAPGNDALERPTTKGIIAGSRFGGHLTVSPLEIQASAIAFKRGEYLQNHIPLAV
mgnify:CR=1 FL=1